MLSYKLKEFKDYEMWTVEYENENGAMSTIGWIFSKHYHAVARLHTYNYQGPMVSLEAAFNAIIRHFHNTHPRD